MNTKIYFNDSFIELEKANLNETLTNEDNNSNTRQKSIKILEGIVHEFLNQKNHSPIYLKTFVLEDIIELFKKEYYYIQAAGGLIEKNGQFLFIHRHNRWDLPKGKLEKNESIEAAAIRECEEECGVKNLLIEKKLNSTFHIYPFKKSFAFKQSFWFYMKTNYNENLIPQIEEDIDEVRWFNLEEIKVEVLSDTYFTIKDLVRHSLTI